MNILRTRVIPVLLLKNNGLYKGKKFKNHTYVGDPHNALKIFNDKEVDELVILDITATTSGKGPNYDLLEEIAGEAFMPLAYGGGITKLEDIDKIFSIGFEKIILNTACYTNPELITIASNKYGSQSIVSSIDVKRSITGKYYPYIKSGTQKIKVEVTEYAKRIVKLGAGEIVLNSINNDGLMTGYDISVIEKICSILDVPVVACGGASSVNDFVKAKEAGASAVAAGAMFVYQGPHRAVLINYPQYKDLLNCLGEN